MVSEQGTSAELILLDLLEMLESGSGQVVDMDEVISCARSVIEDNRALRSQIKGLRDSVGMAMPLIQAMWNEAVRKIVPMWTMLEPYFADEAPMGTAWAEHTASGYEEQNPVMITGTCFVCGGGMYYRRASVPGDTGRWIHRTPITDGHEAMPGVRA